MASIYEVREGNDTLALDGRPPLGDLYCAFNKLTQAGWTRLLLYCQPAGNPLNRETSFPVYAYSNQGFDRTNQEPYDLILIAGIHGREPAGPITLANCIPEIIDCRARILVLPITNPWGYQNNERYGPMGASVGDMEECLGYTGLVSCPAALRLAGFFGKIPIGQNTLVIDLHEDPIFESAGFHPEDHPESAFGTYFYTAGEHVSLHPMIEETRRLLKANGVPLIPSGCTRFGEVIIGGVVENPADGSLDQLLALLGANVITPEILVSAPSDPPLDKRTQIHCGIIHRALDFVSFATL